ncbi:hypothetical protein FG93_01091 [Bosea sp. LC85]|uniref:hypothetical protein n=1 Tax=Bosea sp. LC85 TaxID=1502851 RepID=UPI0004E3FE85|nr:hypothetical protein [Bosea sp. LC85]KFC74505.1 hypothetical protein FG93_01091 [Bosea sp. LC85]
MADVNRLQILKKLFVWYLPQAALFALGAYLAAEKPGFMLLAGMLLAGMYTAAVLVIRDAPSNWRGLSTPWRRALIALIVGFAAVPFWVGYRSDKPLGESLFATLIISLITLPFFGLIWLLVLAFTNDLTARRRHRRARHDDPPGSDGLRVTGARRSLGEPAEQRKRIGVRD